VFWVDAFTDRVFSGNPAAVVLLDAWPTDGRMQAIAAENGVSETAYLVREAAAWRIRWFTPRIELDLCGHATLAAAFVVMTRLDPGANRVEFLSKSGPLAVTRADDSLVLDLPTQPATPCAASPGLVRALGRAPSETLEKPHSYVAAFDGPDAVASLTPDMALLAALDRPSVIVTAPGLDCDFVSRFFAPAIGVPEDPVTGSAHCTLTPFWSKKLGKTRLHARQLSARGGALWCEDRGERVRLGGHAVLFLEGRLHLPDEAPA
jgi:PhzF family phenazine biosynthesis protein